MKPIAEIFTQGEELISGQIVDHNSAWLSQQLTDLGFAVRRHTTVGDNLDDLAALIKEIAARADCCICTGGLGPTSDDLTAEAVSIASGRPLQLDAVAFEHIKQYFACRERSMPDVNRKQAMLPETALRIDNALGTAPGFALRIQRCWFVFLPGVPSEMKGMFTASVREQLFQRFELRPDCLVTLRTVGIGESAIQEKLEALSLPVAVQLGFRATPDEVQTKLLFPAGFDDQEKHTCVERVATLIGGYVFAVDGLQGEQGGMLDVVDRSMLEKRYTLAVLETASQGLIAAKCLGRDWLKAAEIGLDIAQTACGFDVQINTDDLASTAHALATSLKNQTDTDLALVQIYYGDRSAFGDKDRGIVLYNALATPDGVFASRISVAGTANRKQNQAALLALDILRRYLQDKCL